MTERVIVPIDVTQFIRFNLHRETSWQVIQSKICLDDAHSIESSVILPFDEAHATFSCHHLVLYQLECLEDEVVG